MIVDSHCHLDFPELQNRLDDVLAAATAAGVERMVTISTYIARYETYKAIAEKDNRIFFSVGTHPHNAADEPDTKSETLVKLANAHPRCIAIGEAGLDYHYDNSPRDIQKQVFITHIAAARETGLPLVIHARQADTDMIDILRQEMGKGAFKAVLHCFSSGEELARVGVELGLYLSFSGIATFRNSQEIRDIAAKTPVDRILVETDAPYLAPMPHRGKPNEPAYTAFTAKVVAETVGMEFDAFCNQTTDNFYRLFTKAAKMDGREG
ncbi:TatD family hydrolase [Microvirga sp. W0021]|uniref:TatD family hydrolase n=1 Tax=Hohaiivirga grylli TaxID=3133970 RepID=A0ABV0BJ98_9HYPH